jgi:hypothetical protein
MGIPIEDYIKMQARLQPTTAEAVAMSEKTILREAELHQMILDEVRRRGWIAFHGSMAHRTYRTPGEPDLLIFGDNGRHWLIEVKVGGNKLSLEQQAIAAQGAKLGHPVHVVRSFKQFLRIVDGTEQS